jgi:rhodanese-related sulfurtransferase
MTVAISLMLASIYCCGSGEKPPLLDQENVKSVLSDHNVILLDVRAPKNWNVSDKKIKGAMRQDPYEVNIWAANLPKDKKIVLY